MKKLLLISFFLFTSTSFSFAESTDRSASVNQFIFDLGNGIIKASKDEQLSNEAKKDKIIQLIDDSIDAKWISRFVLGINYRIANTQQRDRFKESYRQFMVNTYGPKFKNYKGDRFKVKEVIKQKRFYLVKTDFITKETDPSISIDFRVKYYKGKLSVLDIIAEGISLIETQRSEFNSAISQNGINKFLDDLDERVKRLTDGTH